MKRRRGQYCDPLASRSNHFALMHSLLFHLSFSSPLHAPVTILLAWPAMTSMRWSEGRGQIHSMRCNDRRQTKKQSTDSKIQQRERQGAGYLGSRTAHS